MTKTLLALAGAVILLAAVLGVKTCADRASSRERFVFDTTQVDQVVRLELGYEGQSAALLKRDGRWFTSIEAFPVDSVRLRTVLTALLSLRATEIVSQSQDSGRLAEFGLGAEAKRIRWKLTSGKEYTVLVGKTSGTDFSSTFWKWEDARDVYRTPGTFTHEASVNETDWKSRTLFAPFRQDEVASVAVDWIDSAGKPVHYRIRSTGDSTARLVEPLDAPLLRRVAEDLFVEATQFEIDAFPEPWEERALMGLGSPGGLDSPQVKIEIALKDNRVVRLVAGAPSLDGHRFAILPGTDLPVKILERRFVPFRKTVEWLMNPPPRLPGASEGGFETLDPSTFDAR